MLMSRGDRKQIVSVRVATGDLEKVKHIARRLRVREADVFRFAIKATLARLGPLHDRACVGVDVMPVFAEHGEDIVSYFELDEERLHQVINLGAEVTDKEVSRDDLSLLALAAMPDSYNARRQMDRLRRHLDPADPALSLREYLYRKYVSQDDGDGPDAA